jgi:peptide deformylase
MAPNTAGGLTRENIERTKELLKAASDAPPIDGTGGLYLVPNTDPVLWQTAEEVKDIATQVAPYVDAMCDLMRANHGVGLAAPQVGLPLRFFITALPGLRVVINPRIMLEEGHRISAGEGCLSWPGRRAFVLRRQTIVADFTALNGKVRTLRFDGFAARVFQHECDHLEGRNIFARHAEQPST